MQVLGLLILAAAGCLCACLEECSIEESSREDQVLTCEGKECTTEFGFATIEELEEKVTKFVEDTVSKMISKQPAGTKRMADETAIIHRRDCNRTSFNFPANPTVKDYILFNGTLPQLTKVSICVWLSPHAGGEIGKGTIISYYRRESAQGNTLVVHLHGPTKLGIMTHQSNWAHWKINPVRHRSHFCFLVNAGEQWVEVFINGSKQKRETLKKYTNFSSNRIIPSGGALVIGTDQDKAKENDFVGKIEATQTFTGKIENLFIWDQIVNETEITMMSKDSCYCPRKYLIYPNENNVETCGSAQVTSTYSCP